MIHDEYDRQSRLPVKYTNANIISVDNTVADRKKFFLPFFVWREMPSNYNIGKSYLAYI